MLISKTSFKIHIFAYWSIIPKAYIWLLSLLCWGRRCPDQGTETCSTGKQRSRESKQPFYVDSTWGEGTVGQNHGAQYLN